MLDAASCYVPTATKNEFAESKTGTKLAQKALNEIISYVSFCFWKSGSG